MGESPPAEINADKLYVTGSGVLYNTKMRLSKENYMYGYRAGADGIFDTSGLDSMYLEVGSYQGFTDAEVTCNAGTSCTIVCLTCTVSLTLIAEAGSSIEVHCPYDDYSCYEMVIFYEGDELCLKGSNAKNTDLNVGPPVRRLITKQRMDEPAMPSNQAVDGHRNLLEDLECHDSKECKGQTIDASLYDDIECYGSESCQNVFLHECEESIACGGFASCEKADLETTGNMYCNGHHSCISTRLAARRVYAQGFQSNLNGLVYFDTDDQISFYPQGYESFQNGLFICPGTSTNCYVRCQGMDSCVGAVFDFSAAGSDDIADFECRSFSGCSESNGFRYVSPCINNNDDPAACRKNEYCVYHDSTCQAKNQFCNGGTKAECTGNGKRSTCRWHKNECKLKKNQLPSTYRKFDVFT